MLFIAAKTEKILTFNVKVTYMYIETRIKLKEEVALVLLSAQVEERP